MARQYVLHALTRGGQAVTDLTGARGRGEQGERAATPGAEKRLV